MKEIDAVKFKEIVQCGMEHLFQDRELLNRINVFPVADGDTGDNLVFTLKPVYDQIAAMDESRLDNLAARLAAEMLMSAKGNSGVIFSQFFFSFAKALKGKAAIGPADFSLAMEKAVHETYASIAVPKEGTILTVLRHSAEEFKRLALNGEKYQVIFEKAVIACREILEKTRHMLPQLKKAKVVDAGGLGFYLFFKGMGAAVLDKKRETNNDLDRFDRVPEEVEESSLAFCAEWVLRAEDRDKDFFKKILRAHGDSLLIAGEAGLLHLHIHTDDPAAVEKELVGHGEIVSRKVDSLHKAEIAVVGNRPVHSHGFGRRYPGSNGKNDGHRCRAPADHAQRPLLPRQGRDRQGGIVPPHAPGKGPGGQDLAAGAARFQNRL